MHRPSHGGIKLSIPAARQSSPGPSANPALRQSAQISISLVLTPGLELRRLDGAGGHGIAEVLPDLPREGAQHLTRETVDGALALLCELAGPQCMHSWGHNGGCSQAVRERGHLGFNHNGLRR